MMGFEGHNPFYALLGGIPIGAPIVGWAADHLGPRWALGLGVAAGFAAAAVAIGGGDAVSP